MSFNSSRHPRGFGGKFISAGGHRERAQMFSGNRKASLSRARVEEVRGARITNSVASKRNERVVASLRKTADLQGALASVHAHAAKRIESGHTGRLGSGHSVAASQKRLDAANKRLRATKPKQDGSLPRLKAARKEVGKALTANLAARAHIRGTKVKR